MHKEQCYQQAKKATINGAIANALLSIVKIVFGILGSSAAVLADGFHSLSDLLTDLMVLVVAKIGKQAPDQTHPYGHGRVETVGSSVLGIILIIIGLGLVYDAFYHVTILHTELLSKRLLLFVILLSIITNEKLFRYTMKVANRINSNLLRANAWHKRSDALSSVVVLVGVVVSMFGIHYFDTIAAVIVALLIVKMGIKMIWDSIKELIDTGLDDNTIATITEFITTIPGVIAAHQLRSRAAAGVYYLDLHIQVDPYLTVSESHFIADKVAEILMKKFKQLADVTVHIDIEYDEGEDKTATSNLPSRRELQQLLAPIWAQLPGYQEIQYWRLHYMNNKIIIELFLPYKLIQQEDLATLCFKYRKAAVKYPYIENVKLYFS